MDLLVLRAGLGFLAALSPLLTFGHLWQLKEWRMDRLMEHLRREHWLQPLLGVLRPVIFILTVPLLFWHELTLLYWCVFLCGLFTALTCVQVILWRQPLPTWTKKAIVLMGTSSLLNAVILFSLVRNNSAWTNVLTVAVTLSQPVIVMVSTLLFLPLDRYLKKRILERATALRKTKTDLQVIGVTGSVGKTTTKELLAHVLKPLKAKATPAHVNSEMGVAQWLTNILTKNDIPPILIVEMGAYKRGEIALLASIAQPTMGVVTAVGTQHIALFGSAENIFLAKSELVQSLGPNGRAFLNGDDEGCRRMKDLAKCPVTLVGTGGHADIEATDIEETTQGLRFRVGPSTFLVNLRGTHNVRNILLTIAVARTLGMTDEKIAAELRTFEPPSRTFQVRHEADVEILDDTYNSSPQSFKAAIAWAKSQPFDRKILLASGLIELGEEFEDTHRELGAQAQPVFERVIFLEQESADMFASGFGKHVELYGKTTPRIPAGSLLVCVGRMTPGTIKRLLPSSTPA